MSIKHSTKPASEGHLIYYTKEMEVTIPLAPKDVARMFTNMYSDDQALFFNAIAEIVEDEWSNPFVMQLAEVTRSAKLKDKGKKIMQEIGEMSSTQNS